MFGTELRFVRAEGRGASGLAVRGVGMRCGILTWVGIKWGWDAMRNTNTNASYSKGRAALQPTTVTDVTSGGYTPGCGSNGQYASNVQGAIYAYRSTATCKICMRNGMLPCACRMPDAGSRMQDAGCRMDDVLKVWLCVGVLWGCCGGG